MADPIIHLGDQTKEQTKKANQAPKDKTTKKVDDIKGSAEENAQQQETDF